MRMYDIIEKKKHNFSLSQEEINFVISGLTLETIPDYQISALLMAIYFNGMNEEETFNLTMSMLSSGKIMSKGDICGLICDKHSTGGVSDSTTLIVVPVICALGLKFAKLSGRGLGHTGGTLDKLESFKNFNVNLTLQQFYKTVNEVGAAIAGQTDITVPADKKLYALRDVTATIDNISLIASSIMSKKLSSFADIIILDVKYGNGAFMKTKEEAQVLAKAMVDIGKRAKRKVGALITSMAQPLGSFIGCNLEVKSAIDILKGEKNDLYSVSKELCVKLLQLSGEDEKSAAKKVDMVIDSGAALQKLKEIVLAQGGDIEVIQNENLLLNNKFCSVKSIKNGYITNIDAEKLGNINVILGGGRANKNDDIDHFVGLEIKKRLNDYVKKGEEIIRIYYNVKGLEEAKNLAKQAFKIEDEKVTLEPLIYKYID